MTRYRLTLEYDGGGLAGWQAQPGLPTVQGHVEEAIRRFCGEEVTLHCAGRTDAGVHALSQVAHVDLSVAARPFRVQQATNFHLHGTRIVVVAAEEVGDDFHARFSAKARHYRYRILARRARPAIDAGQVWHVPVPLDVAAMRQAAALLLGHHDFSSFRDSECQAASPMKTLNRLEVLVEGDELHIEASARSFLHHQVRNMVGSLTLVGRGKWSLDDFRNARDAADRRAGGPTAPAAGLCLLSVDY